jgi:ATP-dependent DNA helicase RecQ
MREACRKSLKQKSASWWLKEYINLYFNSKYIRKDYTFKNRSGDCITASITDDTNNGRNFDMKWVWKYIQVVDEDPSGSQIDNLKHLQGACRRLLMNQPDSYTILFLDAYTIYMLDSQNPDNLREAENLLIHAFTSLQDNEPELSLEQLDVIYKRFIEVLKNNNDQLEKNMKQLGFSFDSTNVMLTKYIRTLQKANSFLKSINKVLNL